MHLKAPGSSGLSNGYEVIPLLTCLAREEHPRALGCAGRRGGEVWASAPICESLLKGGSPGMAGEAVCSLRAGDYWHCVQLS